MNKTKRILAVAVAMMAASWARADVLETIPSDAMVAIKVANLGATSKKVAKLATDFGIAQFVQPLNDPLGAVKGKANIQKGLNENGDLGFAILPTRFNGGVSRHEPGLIIIVPVTNFAEFVSNFEGATTEGGVAQFKFMGDNDTTFAGDWGTYVALSPTKELVAKPSSTLKLKGLPAKEAARQDAIVYANFAAITPEATPEMEKAFGRLLADFDRDAKKEIPEKWVPVLRVTITQLMNAARGFFRDVDSATLGVNISDNGINSTVVAEFKPDSYVGKIIAQNKNTEAPLTVGVPQGKFLYYGGVALEPAALSVLFDDFSKPILDELNKVEGQQKVQALVTNLSQMIKTNRGAVFGMPTPAKIGEDALFSQIAVYEGDSKLIKATFDSAGELATSLLAEIKMPDGKPAPKFTIAPGSKTIEGVSLDNWKLEPPMDKDDPNAMQMEMMMGTFYGSGGLNYSFGPLTDTQFVFATAASDASIGNFVKSVRAKEDNISKLEHVKAVTNELPKQRVFEAYIALDEIAMTGVAVAGQFGFPVPVQLPPDLSPVGMTAGTEGPALRMDAHIPSSTVQALISAGMQVFMQMQAPRGGGGQL